MNIFFVPSAFAQAQQQSPSDIFGMMFPMAVVFAIFYFLIIRPQRKRDQQHQKAISELQKGDEIVTQSGLFGKISGITDKVVTLEVAPNTKVKILKTTVLQKVDSTFLQQPQS